ncbi:MAG: YebC/PmpR family DNA-binding transcriptional regulator [Bacilli bacterium]|nr:YebC/PmpR family DNA-binding transcriptional regulator [Bacilli bacterium]
MGRAYEVRKASIQKTGAIKAKLYSMYAKEIYLAAKNGGVEIDSNISLKRIVDKAKKDQVPSDIIKRAIDKVSNGVDESYESVRYELFGPGGSTLIVDCLTDNVNRSVSNIRAALNKTNSKLGVSGSVGYMYDNLSIVGFKYSNEEEVLEALIEEGIEIIDIELDDDNVIIYGSPTDLYAIKETIYKKFNITNFEIEEISMLPKDKINLDGENLEDFTKLLSMLDDIEDVSQVYHNVNL